MAVVRFDGTEDQGWNIPEPDPTTFPSPRNTPAPSNKDQIWGSIADTYQKELGRSKDQIGQDEYLNWARDLGNGQWGFSTGNWQDLIKNSAEAQAYRQRTAAGGSNTGGGSANAAQIGQAWLAYANGLGRRPSSQDVADFFAKNSGWGASVGGSKGNKVTIGGKTYKLIGATSDPNAAFAQWLDITNGEGSSDTTSTYGNSANTELYVNEILSRLQQLRQPIDDPFNRALQVQALQRVQQLQGDPYTAGQDAALVAKYREPLTQARDAQYQRNREEAARRGFMQSSGLLGVLDQNTDKAYQQAVASGSNDLAVQAITERDRRAQEGLAILSALVNAENARRTEIDNRSNQLVSTAALLPGLDERRLSLLLDAANGGTQANNSALSNLLQLATLNQSANQTNSANSQNNAATFGAYLAQLLKNLGGQGATA